MTNHQNEVKRTIADNRHMVIATASKEGVPWVTPVFFAYDEEHNLYWASEKISRHSMFIKENPHVAIVIYDTDPENEDPRAIYFDAEAKELSESEEIAAAMELFNARVLKDKFKIQGIEGVAGDGAWRLYKATPAKVYELTDGEYVNGQYVDRRVEVELN